MRVVVDKAIPRRGAEVCSRTMPDHGEGPRLTHRESVDFRKHHSFFVDESQIERRHIAVGCISSSRTDMTEELAGMRRKTTALL